MTQSKIVKELLTMDDKEFRQVVDQDLRKDSSNKRARAELPEGVSKALRDPDVAKRWLNHLSQMQRTVEGTLAAREAESESKRSSIRQQIFEAEASREPTAHLRALLEEEKKNYLYSRAGTLRFKSGLDETALEARAIVERHDVEAYRSQVFKERNSYAARTEELEKAIREHKEDFYDEEDDLEPSKADLRLWGLVP